MMRDHRERRTQSTRLVVYVLFSAVAILLLAVGRGTYVATQRNAVIQELEAAGCDVVFQNTNLRGRRRVPGRIPFIDDFGLPPVTRISLLGSSDVSAETLAQMLDYVPEVEVLDLRETSGQESVLHELGTLRYLKSLDLSGLDISDDSLMAMCSNGDFPELENLALAYTKISSRGLARLRNLPALEELDVSGTQVSSDGLDVLENLHRLRVIRCSGTALDDEACVYLGNVTSLRHVTLAWTRISPACGEAIGELQGLEHLDLCGTCVDARTIKSLLPMPHLRTLLLDDTRIDSSAIALLSRLESLERLDIARTEIGDAALPDLESLTNLRVLCIRKTRVSEEAAQHLKSALPMCKIVHD